MIAAKRLKLAVLFLSPVLLVGCGQNSLKIRVDKVQGVSSTRLDPNSRLGRQLDEAIADLGLLVDQCNEADSAMDSFKGLYGPDEQEIVEDALGGYREVVDITRRRALELKVEVREYFNRGEISEAASDIRMTLRRISAFFDEAKDRFATWAAAFKRSNAFSRLFEFGGASPTEVATRGDQARDISHAFQRMQTVAAEAEKPSPGFGGFQATDIYAISPSDPLYDKILAKDQGSAEPLTLVKVDVTGDSSIMLVMEHPGQFRVYQVSNDPTQITRNIALVVSKATGAVAKFAGVGLAP